MKRLAKPLGILAAAICTGYFVAFALRNLERMPAIELSARAWSSFAGAVLSIFAASLIAAWAWSRLLRDVGSTPAFAAILKTMLVSQIAKYLPGNVGQYIGRVAIGKKYGIDPVQNVLTLVLEIPLVITACILVAIGTLSMQDGRWQAQLPIPQAISMLTIGVAGVIVLLAGIRWALERSRATRLVQPTLRRPEPRTLAWVLSLYGLTFLCQGTALRVILEALFQQPPISVLMLTGLYALAWLPGFVAPGVPGGLGVREAALALALSPLVGEGNAIAITLASRLANVTSETLGVLVGLAIRASKQPG